MLGYILSLLDILAAGTIILGHFGLAKIPLLYSALYLFTKLFFFRDLLTWIDAAAGVYCVFLFFGFASELTWIFIGFFAYKTAMWIFYTLSH